MTLVRVRSLVVAAVVGAGGAGDTVPPAAGQPWDEPVAGAVAVTDWEDHGQPTTPFGPGGYAWGSPDELLTAMAQAFTTYEGVSTAARVVERRDNGTVVGWVRIDIHEVIERQGLDEPALATDMRVEMRSEGGAWFVARTESRDHCVRPLTDQVCR